MRAAARGNYVYPAQQVKNELVAAFGVEAAFGEWREIAGLPEDARLVRKPLLELHGAALARARSYLLQEPAGESVSVAPPRIVGPHNSRPLQARPRTRFVACFEDVQVRGRSSVIEFDDALLLDFEGDELASIDDNLDLDPAIFSADGEQAWTLPMAPDSARLELDEAFQLSGTHTWAFGHWMWEYLPRYVDASMEPSLPVMPVLVDEEMPPQHLQALRALLARGAGIVQLPRMASARVHRLWTAPTPMYMPLYEQINERYRWDLLAAHPGRFALLAAEMNKRVDAAFDATPSPSAPRRVFLARKPERHRKMCNSPEIETLLHARGFETVYPEDLDFDEQVRMMRGADWVIGPEGSAMFLAFFARPGTRICILNHPFTLGMTVLTSLLEELRLDVSMFTGPALTENRELPHFIDYSIDAEALGRFVDAEARA